MLLSDGKLLRVVSEGSEYLISVTVVLRDGRDVAIRR